VRKLGKPEFTLQEMYAFEPQLKALHPTNQNVRPKIRQQLQMLRDVGLVRFGARGNYRVV
jgi:type II restriction enzyme